MVLLGKALESASEQILRTVDEQPVTAESPLIETASPLADGLIMRIAGITTQLVADCVTRRLCFLESLLGETPWARKW